MRLEYCVVLHLALLNFSIWLFYYPSVPLGYPNAGNYHDSHYGAGPG